MALRNGQTEVVVVPAIGRIMSLGFAGDGGASDPLWRHGQIGPNLAGDENGWINYGGDKAWPAPQAEWERMVGKGWPPPTTFDATAHAATMKGAAIEMVSPIDPAYGMRVRRTVSLFDDHMLIDTAYEKVEGPSVRVAVWTITQLVSPDRVFALLPERSSFPGGHRSTLPAAPKDVSLEGRLLGIARHPTEKTMLVNDAEALLWVGRARSRDRKSGDPARRRRRAAAGRRARADLHQPRRRRALRRAGAARPARRSRAASARR